MTNDERDERLERILQRINLANCPRCGAPVLAENVVADGNRHAMDDAVFPKVWLVCKWNNYAMRLLDASPTYFIKSYDDVLKAFEDALNIR